MTGTQAAETMATSVAKLARVRGAATGGVFMLILQFLLGIIYNLYGTAPTSTKAIGLFSNGWLIVHEIMAILLLAATIGLVVQAIRTASGLAKGLSWVALISIVGAIGAGISFTRSGASGASLGMALAFALALWCYAVLLVRLPSSEP
jgi:hypothetical protein